MKRILVIGQGGAGKSTFATRLGQILGLKVVHLDSIYWRAGWIETPKDEWHTTVENLLEGDNWIIDGNYSGTLKQRLAAADAVIFLDLPRRICVWRVIRRAVQYRSKTRPDMAEGCPERLNMKFLLWIWNYRRRSRPHVLELVGKTNVTLVHLQSTKDV